MERAPQEEQNGTNFSSVAPSSEELRVRKEIDRNGFWSEKSHYLRYFCSSVEGARKLKIAPFCLFLRWALPDVHFVNFGEAFILDNFEKRKDYT